jgi:hypothetical protein
MHVMREDVMDKQCINSQCIGLEPNKWQLQSFCRGPAPAYRQQILARHVFASTSATARPVHIRPVLHVAVVLAVDVAARHVWTTLQKT